MTREWGLVALSCTIMVLAGAIVFGAILKAPFNVGSIGQWASAIGTVTAVWVAVRNTENTLKSTANREELRKKEADRAYIAAICALSNQINQAISLVHQKSSGKPMGPVMAKALLHRTNLKGLVAALDRLPLHQAPHYFFVGVYDNVRTSAQHTVEKFEEIAAAGKPAIFEIDDEAKLLDETLHELKSYLEEEKEIEILDIFD